MANLYFEAQLDAEQLKRELRELNTRLNSFSKNAATQGEELDNTFKRIGQAAAGYFSITAAQGFIGQVIQVRGEVQQLDISLQKMLQNKELSDKVLAQTVQLAAKTPFTFSELGQGTKQLIAFQVPAEQVNDTLKRLGDVAAGVSAPVGDLIRAYGQVKAKGRLQAEEINQFAERGVPLIAELAKELGVTNAEVLKLSANGKIGFEQLEKVIRNLTNEGGQFFNLMEEQAGSLTGLVSNLNDAIDRMFNDIGQSNEALLSGGIKGLTELVENYEEVVKVLGVIVATYGAYRAALILTTVAQKAQVTAGAIQAWFSLAKGIRSAKDAQIAFSLATKANPWGLAAAAVAALVTSLALFKNESKEVNEEVSESAKKFGEESLALETLFTQLGKTNNGSKERSRLVSEINSKYGTNLQNLSDEKKFLEQIDAVRANLLKKLKEELILNAQKEQIVAALGEQALAKFQLEQTEKRIEQLEALGNVNGADKLRAQLAEQQQLVESYNGKIEKIMSDSQKELDSLQIGGTVTATPANTDENKAYAKQLKEQQELYAKHAEVKNVLGEASANALYPNLLKDYDSYLQKELELYIGNEEKKRAIAEAATNANASFMLQKLNGNGLSNIKGQSTGSVQINTKQLADFKSTFEGINQQLSELGGLPLTLDEMADRYVNIAGNIQSIGLNLNGVNGELGAIVMGIADSVGMIGNTLTEFKGMDWGSMSAGQKTDLITQGVNGIIQVGSMLVNSAKQRRDAEVRYYNDLKAAQHDYLLGLNEQLRLQSELADNVFFKDNEGKLQSGAKSMFEANIEYQKALAKLEEDGKAKKGQKNAVDWGNVGAGAAGGAAAGAAIGTIVPVIGTVIGGAVGAVAGAVAGLFGGKKKKDTFGSITGLYPDLIQEAADGTKTINKQLAESLLNNNQLNKETKKLVQNALDWAGAVEAAQEQIKATLADMVGGMGDDLKNKLVNAFKEGTSAAVAFGDAVEGVLEGILEDLIFAAVFKDSLDALQKEMENSYSLTGDQSIADDLARFYNNYGQLASDYMDGMTAAQAEANKAGLELWKSSTEDANGLAGGIRRELTEETGSRLAGLFNVMSLDTRSIANDMKVNLANNVQQLNQLMAIEFNTAQTAINTETTVFELQKAVTELKAINNNTSSNRRAEGW